MLGGDAGGSSPPAGGGVACLMGGRVLSSPPGRGRLGWVRGGIPVLTFRRGFFFPLVEVGGFFLRLMLGGVRRFLLCGRAGEVDAAGC